MKRALALLALAVTATGLGSLAHAAEPIKKPQLVTEPSTLEFSDKGSQRFKITNRGDLPLEVKHIAGRSTSP
jgi:hypothetical protein